MSEEQAKKRRRRRSGSRSAQGGGPDQQGADGRSRGSRDGDHRGGRQRGGDRNGPRRGRGSGDSRRTEGRGGSRSPQPQNNAATAMEYLLVGPQCLAGEVYGSSLPVRWRKVPEIRLLRPGLYLRNQGHIQALSEELTFDEAVQFVRWPDPETAYAAGHGNFVRPGLNCGFLVRHKADNSPPWIPVLAAVNAGGSESKDGLLSTVLDPVRPASFHAALAVSKGSLTVTARGSASQDDAARSALRETLRWLADNPDADSAGAVIARQVMVAEGHGLQRYGLSLTHGDDAERDEALTQILPRFAPELAELLSALVAACTGDGDRRAAALQLAHTLNRCIRTDGPLQRGDQMAIFVCFMSGLFGPRPARDAVYPARALFATARALRRIARRDELIDDVNADIPAFPLTEPEAAWCRSELGAFPDDETNFERIIRALAVAESSRDFHRPSLDHLRPFAISFGRVRQWPVAARTFMARYDGILTGWSFRGAEVLGRPAPAAHLAANLILDATTLGGTRALARVLGSGSDVAPALAEALNHRSEYGPGVHPRLAHLSELYALNDDELVAAAGEAAGAKLTRIRLFTAVSTWEMLVARNERRGGFSAEWEPTLATLDDDHTLVSTDFMYWRATCRSVHWPAANAYGNFIESWLPRLDTLTPKLEAELLVLLRQWLRQSADHRGQAAGFVPILEQRFAAILDDESTHPGSDERVFALVASIASLSQAAWSQCVRRLIGDGRYDLSDFGRVLDSPRQSGWGDELVKDDVFRECHGYLIAGDSPRYVIARPEWVRHALERARGAASVRWLVSRGGHSDFVASPQFASWFRQRGLRAIEDPQTALIELLEIATRTVSEPYLDIVQQHLLDRTIWPPQEHRKHLIDSGRSAAAVRWMRLHGAAESDPAALRQGVATMVEQAQTAAEVLVAAREIAALRRAGEEVDDLIAALRPKCADRISPFLRRAAAAQVETLQLLGGDEAADADAALAAAKAWVQSGADAQLDEVAWEVERAVAAELGHEIDAFASSPSSAQHLVDSARSFEMPPEFEALTAFEQKLDRKNPRRRALRRVASLARYRLVDAALSQAVADAVKKGEDVTAALAVLASPAPPEAAPMEATPADEPAVPPMVAETEPAPAMEVSTAVANSELTQDDAVGSADAPAATKETQGRRKRPKKSKGDGTTLNARVADALSERITAVGARWMARLALDPKACEHPLAARARNFWPHDVRLRADLAAPAAWRGHTAGVTVHDPRRLLSTDFLSATTFIDPEDFLALMDVLLRLRSRHNLNGRIELQRNGVIQYITGTSPHAPAPAEAPEPSTDMTATVDDTAAKVAVAKDTPVAPEDASTAAEDAAEATAAEATAADETAADGANAAAVSAPEESDAEASAQDTAATKDVSPDSADDAGAGNPDAESGGDEKNDGDRKSGKQKRGGKKKGATHRDATVALFKNGFRSSSADAQALLYGDAVTGDFVAELCDRNKALSLSFRTIEKRAALVLAWVEPRQRRPHKR